MKDRHRLERAFTQIDRWTREPAALRNSSPVETLWMAIDPGGRQTSVAFND